MKKLLAILAMLLALLMIGAVAIAAESTDANDDDQGSSTREGIPYEDIRRVHTLDEHDVSFDQVLREPTCSVKGIARYICLNDPTHFHEAYIATLPHTWKITTKKIGTKDVCCEIHKVCTVCGAEEVTVVKVHEWSSESGDKNWGRVTDEPTCTVPGKAEDYCLVCGLVNDYVKPRVIEPIPHEYVEVDIATCLDEKAIIVEKCKFCGKFVVDDKGEVIKTEKEKDPNKDYHDWDEWVMESPATCAAPESWVRFCKRCGDKQQKNEGDRLEAKWVIKARSRLQDCFHEEVTWECELCHGKVNGVVVPDHQDKKEVREVEAHVYKIEEKYHVPGEKEGEPTKKPTCTEPGYDEYYCIYSEDHKTHKIEIPALGHDWSDWELRIAPNQGDNEYGYWLRECNRCHIHEEKVAQHQPAELCGNDHDFIIWSEKSVAPTCTEKGSILKVCSKCGTEEIVEVPALGHDLIEEVVTEATCAKAGKKLISCTRCDYMKTVAIEKLAHTEEEIPAVAGGCLTDGSTAGKKCSVCGEILVAPEKIPAIGHHDYVKVDAVEPTCTEVGYTAGTKCSVCGDVLVAPVEIPAKGHTVVEVAAVEPTCTKAGSTAGKTCSVCNEVIEAVKEVPATGHKWDDGKITKEATPTEDGVKTFTCTACGETKTEVVPFEFDEEAAYKLEDMSYGANKITGKAVHDATTVESDKLYARVTVFFVGGTYAVFSDYVEDGVIDIEVHGTVLAVSVSLTGSKNVVPGAEMVIFDTWGEYYND